MKKNNKKSTLSMVSLALGGFLLLFIMIRSNDHKVIDSPITPKRSIASETKVLVLKKTNKKKVKIVKSKVSQKKKQKIWAESLHRRLTSQLIDTEVKIKRIKKSKFQKKEVEYVQVEMIRNKTGERSFFSAYIHPKTGKILHTWSQTQKENYLGQNKMVFTIPN
jgi:hypothetical protein